MPFVPHTEADVAAMLGAIGASTLEQLFDEIPAALRGRELSGLPPAMNEWEITRLMQARAAQNSLPLCFMGAGAYEHHIPAAVWEIATRGEFYSAYTPYQAEASQGTLQVVYEYQSMMAALTDLDASNASLYDGASALAEAILMAVRAQRGSRPKRILLPRSLHPHYARVVRAITGSQGIELVELPFVPETGQVDLDALQAQASLDASALVIAQPNVFGVLEDVDALSDWAADHEVLAIGLVNPTALGLLRPPGQWGRQGVSIACGDGQPLGIPLSSGGPYFGFLCCREQLLRQMPGRLVGRTLDLDGRRGFTLTLQAREQHIRRSRATSNICTNQGLMVTAATIYMSLLGPEGLRRVAAASHANTVALLEQLVAIPGVDRVFAAPHFHEAVLNLSVPPARILEQLRARNILGGVALASWYPELENGLLVCATETKSTADITLFTQALAELLQEAADG
jgi:glycine dehydrogenase subunit 1